MCLSKAERGPPGHGHHDLGAGSEQGRGVAHQRDRVVDVLEHLGADRVRRRRLLAGRGPPARAGCARRTCAGTPCALGDLAAPGVRPRRCTRRRTPTTCGLVCLEVDGELALAAADVEHHGALGQRAEQLEHHRVAVVVGRVALGGLAVLVPVVVPVVLVGPVGVEPRWSARSQRVAGGGGVVVEHLDGLERELVEVLAEAGFILASRSGVTVMMWTPTSSAWTMLSTSRGLAQSSSSSGSWASACERLGHQRDRVAAGVGDAAGEDRDDVAGAALRRRRRPPRPARPSSAR